MKMLTVFFLEIMLPACPCHQHSMVHQGKQEKGELKTIDSERKLPKKRRGGMVDV